MERITIKQRISYYLNVLDIEPKEIKSLVMGYIIINETKIEVLTITTAEHKVVILPANVKDNIRIVY